MRNLILISLFYILIFSFNKKTVHISEKTKKEVSVFIHKHNQKLKKQLGEGRLYKEKMAVVYPELLKYSLYKDIIETKALELLYVSYGKEKSDFSLGYFQMKPSFVEKLENEVLKYDELVRKYTSVINYNINEEKYKRKQRIERLKMLKWQLIYLNCFYDYIILRFPFLENKNDEYRIRFLSTAYNHDLLADEKEIEKWMFCKLFPYGKIKGYNQYAYSDIALYFYKNN